MQVKAQSKQIVAKVGSAALAPEEGSALINRDPFPEVLIGRAPISAEFQDDDPGIKAERLEQMAADAVVAHQELAARQPIGFVAELLADDRRELFGNIVIQGDDNKGSHAPIVPRNPGSSNRQEPAHRQFFINPTKEHLS